MRGGIVGVIFTCLTVICFNYVHPEIHTNHWLIELHDDDPTLEVAKEIAKRTGFSYVSPVLNSKRHFHLTHKLVPHVRTRRSTHHTESLIQQSQVKHAEQLEGYVRAKRGYNKNKIVRGIPVVEPSDHFNEATLKTFPNDPLYSTQWYINNTGQAGGIPGLDLHVEAAWSLGYSGKGIITAILDDGIDYLHPELEDNFDADTSYDISSNDPFPYPRYTDDWFNSHGTRCAGEIASKRNNNLCGVGIAYGSKVAGIRMLDQPYMNDAIEARSMGHEMQKIHIYSASWGPTDDGKTLDGPRKATTKALLDGINKGRNGLGNIYVWASGDGGRDDNCNCDGYTVSMWTISINSVTNDGQTATYAESCSSTLASTFSNGKSGFADAGVTTADLYGKCTKQHSGTSAAAPEAAGVIALTLEANPNLTWRDVQYLIILTSKRNHLRDAKGEHEWKMNGAGLEFNHLFGYGVMDAGDLVDLARVWKTVPERKHCSAGNVSGNHTFSEENPLELSISTTGCEGTDNEVAFIEHVQAIITAKATKRGQITMELTSPSGTSSLLLSKRPNDVDDHKGFVLWPFMTTQTWAENPKGDWKLIVTMVGVGEGVLSHYELLIHGTTTSPYKEQEGLSRLNVTLNNNHRSS